MGMAIIFLFVGLAIGAAVAYLLTRSDSKLQQRNDELKKQLEEADQGLATYKQEVANHFMKTADLVNNMTDSYRSVHEHLAQGANALCSEQLGVEQLDIRQTTLLDKSDSIVDIEKTDEKTIKETSVKPDEITSEPLRAETQVEVQAKEAVSTDETADAAPESVVAKSEPAIDKLTVH
ncbi:MAG: YhcB family protein [Gammaproteobacteria bacterium]|nr:YhcB family protein [Gammaproteobacteria bacterium]